MNMRHLLICLVLAACEPPAPPPPPEPPHEQKIAELKRAAELEAASPCADTWRNATNHAFSGRGAGCRSDQTLRFEKDSDGDAWLVCRCIRAGGEGHKPKDTGGHGG